MKFVLCEPTAGLQKVTDRVLLDHSHRENFTTMKVSPAAILIGSATASQNAVSIREINEECDPQWKPVRASRTCISTDMY